MIDVASGIPVGVLGVEYGWLFATGEESERLFKVFRESCENAVALNCSMLMSAPGQVQGPIKDAIQYLKRAGDIAAEHKLKLAIEFNSQHDVLNSLADEGVKPNCDPTTVVKTAKPLGELKKGSKNAIVVLPNQRPSVVLKPMP